MADIFKKYCVEYRLSNIGHPIDGNKKGENMGSNCCSTSNCGGSRNFLTKEEKIEMLKDYQENLELELKGVKEKIEDLKKSN